MSPCIVSSSVVSFSLLLGYGCSMEYMEVIVLSLISVFM